MVNAEAIFLVSKATEQFISCLALEASHFTAGRKTLQKGDITTAIEATDCLAFLDGAMED
jgi:histone H3/H4